MHICCQHLHTECATPAAVEMLQVQTLRNPLQPCATVTKHFDHLLTALLLPAPPAPPNRCRHCETCASLTQPGGLAFAYASLWLINRWWLES
jgi:hypothetical protein